MIFATAGTQLSFDRFAKIMDSISAEIEEDIIIQCPEKHYTPKSAKMVNFMNPDEYADIFAKARLIVAHAGIGTIVSAMQQNKPIIIFPRVAALGEHRNEHQLATARQMEKLGYAYVAYDEEQLRELVINPDLRPMHTISELASPLLIEAIRENIG